MFSERWYEIKRRRFIPGGSKSLSNSTGNAQSASSLTSAGKYGFFSGGRREGLANEEREAKGNAQYMTINYQY